MSAPDPFLGRELQGGQFKIVGGTPRFMSPEQAQAKPLSPASDVYSLGLILYEMLTGHSPFDARDSLEYAILHVKAAPKPLAARAPDKVFPRELEPIIMKALAKTPEERYPSTADLALELTRVLDVLSEKPAPAPVARSRFPTSVLLAFVLGAMAAVIITVLVLR